MSLTTAIIAVVGLDLAVLGALAAVMRAPFRAAAELPVVPAQALGQPRETAARRRFVPTATHPRTAQSTVR